MRPGKMLHTRNFVRTQMLKIRGNIGPGLTRHGRAQDRGQHHELEIDKLLEVTFGRCRSCYVGNSTFLCQSEIENHTRVTNLEQ